MSETQIDKKAIWQKHLEAHLSSGLSKRAYCKANDLNYATFCYHWKQQNKKSRLTKSETVHKFAPVKLSATVVSREVLSIHFPNGSRLQLPIDINTIHLKELIMALTQ